MNHTKQKNVIGGLLLHRDGYGFVVPKESGQQDVFIPARFVGNAMHKDIVEATVVAGRDNKLEGRIVRIFRRGLRHIIGRFEQRGKFFVVIADENMRVQHTVVIPQGKVNGAKNGETVVVEIISYPGEKDGLTGVITKRFSHRGDEKNEVELVIARHDLPIEFPKRVLEDADRLYRGFHDGEKFEDRKDLRDIPIVTIDGESARDFDDAISVKVLPNSVIRLYVSIADVGYFVREGSSIDKEAYKRGTSVYFPGRCLPMLPHQLSDDLCSLRPDQDRLTVTAEMDFAPDGGLTKSKFYRSVIRSRARMTYTEVKNILVDKDEAVCRKYSRILPMLTAAQDLFERINRKRIGRGSIDFDLPESEIILDIEGGVDSIVKSERNIAHRMIEEFMVAANEAVAEFLTENKLGCLYRVHDGPDPEKIESFKEILYSLGYKVKWDRNVRPGVLANIIKMVSGKPEERLINTLLLRSMAQAVYSSKNIGHFGLASKCYCHFTSPIRRYPDLVVHRLLNRARQLYAPERLREIAENSSIRERVSVEAEREIVSLYVSLFMRDKVGQEFDGIISSVTKFGFFVKLEEYFVEGLVHVDTLAGDHYRFENHVLIGKKSGRGFKIGDMVKVEVADVNVPKREVSFILIS